MTNEIQALLIRTNRVPSRGPALGIGPSGCLPWCPWNVAYPLTRREGPRGKKDFRRQANSRQAMRRRRQCRVIDVAADKHGLALAPREVGAGVGVQLILGCRPNVMAEILALEAAGRGGGLAPVG